LQNGLIQLKDLRSEVIDKLYLEKMEKLLVLDQIIAGSAFRKPSALLFRSSVHSCLSSIRVGSGWRQADGQGLVLARFDEWGGVDKVGTDEYPGLIKALNSTPLAEKTSVMANLSGDLHYTGYREGTSVCMWCWRLLALPPPRRQILHQFFYIHRPEYQTPAVLYT